MHHVNCASEENALVPLDKERYWESGIQCKPERERERRGDILRIRDIRRERAEYLGTDTLCVRKSDEVTVPNSSSSSLYARRNQVWLSSLCPGQNADDRFSNRM